MDKSYQVYKFNNEFITSSELMELSKEELSKGKLEMVWISEAEYLELKAQYDADRYEDHYGE